MQIHGSRSIALVFSLAVCCRRVRFRAASSHSISHVDRMPAAVPHEILLKKSQRAVIATLTALLIAFTADVFFG